MIIWLLNDGRIGNYRQLEAISFYLKDDCKIIEKNITFSKFAKLPNFFNFLAKRYITKSCLKEINHDFPDIILSAGRRSALIASFIKKLAQGNVKIVQILKPEISSQYFDLIITPKHDKYNAAHYEYLLTPNLVKKNFNKQKNKSLHFDKSGKNYAVYIGGSSKHKKVSFAEYNNLLAKLDEIKKYTHCKFYISTSRRTDPSIIKILQKKYQDDYVYDFNSKSSNPHFEFLANSDKIFVTGDSISLISEAISSGKPTIYFPEFSSTKHHNFISPLLSKKILIPFDEFSANRFSSKVINKDFPNEAEKIAKLILDKFQN